jgi:hypothetical protein
MKPIGPEQQINVKLFNSGLVEALVLWTLQKSLARLGVNDSYLDATIMFLQHNLCRNGIICSAIG